jgi:protein-S-isoprenylcysteine O-methyltransferase Ste14
MQGKRRILPPVWFAACLLAAVALHFFLPVASFALLPVRIAGAVIMVFGIYMSATASGAFDRAGTPVVPFERSTVLLTDGWYRYTRNPMYLGMTLALAGSGVALGSVGALLPLPVFIVLIETLFIRGEEEFLEEIFGEDFRRYRTQVRRWF